MEQALEERTQQVIQLLALVQQATGLQLWELHEVLGQVRSAWKPSVDPKAIVQYAFEHGIPDLNEAAQRMRAEQTKAQPQPPRPGMLPALQPQGRHFRQREGHGGRRELQQMLQGRLRPDVPW